MQAIMPPYHQDVVKAVSRLVVNKFEQELKVALQDDPWLRDNPGLLTSQDGLVWNSSKLYIPQALRSRVFQRCHDAKQPGHFGFLKILYLARRQFWWPRMRKDIETYVQGCPLCAAAKPHTGNRWDCYSRSLIQINRGRTSRWILLSTYQRVGATRYCGQ